MLCNGCLEKEKQKNEKYAGDNLHGEKRRKDEMGAQ